MNVTQELQRRIKDKEKLAIVAGNDRCTYGELLEYTSLICEKLLSEGLKSGQKVGIKLDKNKYWVATYLAVWMADCTVVPMDKSEKSEECSKVAKELNINFLICENDGVYEQGIEQLIVKKISNIDLLENTSALIMRTSGSTGKRKAVVISHENIINLVTNKAFTNYFCEETKLLQTGSSIFDAVNFELWCVLFKGGTVFLAHPSEILNYEVLNKLIGKYEINTIWLTFPLFSNIVLSNKVNFTNVKYVFTGGDKVKSHIVIKFYSKFRNTKVINGYGPTECTTFTTTYAIPNDFRDSEVPIGYPIENVTCEIADSNQKFVKNNIRGEIWISGKGISKNGYVNSDNDSFILKDKELWYRTGDIGYKDEKNLLFYVGRQDSQLKVDGYRLDLSEIETYLEDMGTFSSFYILINDEDDQVGLIPYVILNEANKNLTKRQLIKEFYQIAPKYVHLQDLKIVEELPILLNGKIDKAELRKMTTIEEKKDKMTKENLLCIVSDSLEGKKLGYTKSFYDLGMDSYDALNICLAIKSAYEIRLTLWTVLENDTVEKLFSYIENN